MTLYCRNGYYYIRYKKRKLSLHTNDKQIARTIYTRLLFKLVLDELHFSIYSKPLLQQKKKEVKVLVKNVFDDYIKMSKLKGVTKSTINFKNSCFRIIEKCNIVYFSDFNQTNVNKFVEYIQKYSVDTQRKYVTDFYAFCIIL